MLGFVLHLCNLYCHCPSQPLSSLSFSLHISHSITRVPAPSPTSTPRFPYAFLPVMYPFKINFKYFVAFAALTRGLSAFHCSICPFGGTGGIALFCTFLRAKKHSNLTLFTFHCMPRASSENLSKARTDNKSNSEPLLYSFHLCTFRVALLFPHPRRFWHHVIVSLSKCWDGLPWPRPMATPDVYPCPTLRNVGN
jgi:hypothetical protein